MFGSKIFLSYFIDLEKNERKFICTKLSSQRISLWTNQKQLPTIYFLFYNFKDPFFLSFIYIYILYADWFDFIYENFHIFIYFSQFCYIYFSILLLIIYFSDYRKFGAKWTPIIIFIYTLSILHPSLFMKFYEKVS